MTGVDHSLIVFMSYFIIHALFQYPLNFDEWMKIIQHLYESESSSTGEGEMLHLSNLQ